MKRRATLTLIFIISVNILYGQKELLRETILHLTKKIEGRVGVAIMDIATNDTLLYNGQELFPMQSIYKFPLALAVLHAVDEKKLSLNQLIKITKKDMRPNTWSPLTKVYPEGNVEIPLHTLLMYTVTHSDNNACDILFRLLGGPDTVDAYIKSIGIKDMTIVSTEEEMHSDWDIQFANSSKPVVMLQLLEMFYSKKLLSTETQSYLWKWMAETSTGPNRIKGLLPKETEVLHRTGTGSINKEGIVGAVNDVGIVTLRGGKRFAIVVFISLVKGEAQDIEKLIAEITLAAYNSAWLNDM